MIPAQRCTTTEVKKNLWLLRGFFLLRARNALGVQGIGIVSVTYKLSLRRAVKVDRRASERHCFASELEQEKE